MAGRPEGELHLGLHNSLDALLDIRFENLGFGEFLVPMGGQPDPGVRTLLGQDDVSVKHDEELVCCTSKGGF